MKIIVFLSVLAVVFAAPSEDNELTTSEEQFINNFAKNHGTEVRRYFKTALKQMAEAICSDKNTDFETPMEEVINRAKAVDDQSETVCNLIKNHLHRVLEPMTTAIDGCLPNGEAGVAGFIVDAIVSVISKICQSTGEELLELSNPCLDKIDLEDSRCIQNVADKWNEVTKTGTKSFKDLVCSEYTDARPCLETAVNDKCKLPITQHAVMGMLDSAIQTPCHA